MCLSYHPVQTRLRRYCCPPCTHARITSCARKRSQIPLEGGWIWQHEHSHAPGYWRCSCGDSVFPREDTLISLTGLKKSISYPILSYPVYLGAFLFIFLFVLFLLLSIIFNFTESPSALLVYTSTETRETLIK